MSEPPAPPVQLTPRERVRRRVLRLLMRFPPAWQVRLSGRPPVQHGGETLHPELQLLLAFHARAAEPALTDLPPAAGRAALRRAQVIAGGAPIPVGAVRDLLIPVPHGRLPARHYAPPAGEGGRRPLLVFFHGGGFALGDLDTHDAPCRLICREAGVHVLAVDYRLAPEHPFPAAVDDADAAFRWAAAAAADLGADSGRVGVAGDSAGANLAAVVSHLRARGGGPRPGLQVLIYPPVDRTGTYESLAAFASGFFLTAADIDRFAALYAPGIDPADVRIAPLRAPDLSGLPPAVVVTAAFDPLRDEGEAYAAGLAAAGTPVRLRRMPGMIHGFINLIGVSPACRRAAGEVARVVRDHWDRGDRA